MRMQVKEKPLSLAQFFFTIIHGIIGVMIFSLPYIGNIYAKNNSWISVIILLIGFQLMSIVIIALHKRFPEKNLFEIAEIVMGKTIGRVFNLLLSIYYLVMAVYACLYFAFLTMEWILPLTPKPVIYLILLIPAYYIASAKLEAFGRFNCIAIIVTIGLIFSLCFAIPEMKFSFLLPVGEVPLSNIVKASIHIGPVYAGINCILIYLPKVNGTMKAKGKAVFYSLLTISFIYLLATLACVAFLGTSAMDIVIMPVLYLLKSVTILGFFERLDLILISAWLIPSLISFVVYVHLAFTGLTQVIQKKNNLILFALFIIIYVSCHATQLSIYTLHRGRDILLPFNSVSMFAVTPLLLILAVIRKKKFSR
jgi:spore germination protein (amino acid permease)